MRVEGARPVKPFGTGKKRPLRTLRLRSRQAAAATREGKSQERTASEGDPYKGKKGRPEGRPLQRRE
jgi:hypothetical protein